MTKQQRGPEPRIAPFQARHGVCRTPIALKPRCREQAPEVPEVVFARDVAAQRNTEGRLGIGRGQITASGLDRTTRVVYWALEDPLSVKYRPAAVMTTPAAIPAVC